MENVGKTKTCCIKGIVVGGPDVKAQHQNSQIKQVQADHNLKNIVSSYKNRRNSTEEEHQGVADKERNHCGDRADLAVLCETGKVRGCGSAGYKRTYHQSCAAYNGQASAGFGELVNDGAISLLYRHHHCNSTKNRYQRHCNIADNGKGIDSKISGSSHAYTSQDHKSPHGSIASPKKLLGYRNGKHGKSHAEPADLGETDHG